MLLYLKFVATITFLLTSFPAHAAIVISGESINFSGAGVYTLNVFATAQGKAEIIGGFNLSLDFSSPNLNFSSVAYNSAFETIFPVSANANPAELSATDTNFMPLSIGENQTFSLAAITFDVIGPGSASISVGELNDGLFEPIPFSVNPSQSSLTVATAVPEPGSVGLLALASACWVYHRRRTPGGLNRV